MWKKKIAIIMAAAMVTGMSGMTALAEESGMGNGAPQMSGPQFPGSGQAPADLAPQAPQGEAPSDMGQQAPQAPQGEAPADMEQQAPQAPHGEAPSDKGQQAPQAPQAPQSKAPSDMGQQAPQAPQGEASTDNGKQAPQMGQQPSGGDVQKHPGRGKNTSDGRMKNGQAGHGMPNQERASQNQERGKRGHRGPFIDFEACVKDGTISQETYDAIKKYMDENKPDTAADGEKNESSETEKKKPDLLKDLLEAEVITQDEYDALAKLTTGTQEKKAAGEQEEKTAGAQEEKPSGKQKEKAEQTAGEQGDKADKTAKESA